MDGGGDEREEEEATGGWGWECDWMLKWNHSEVHTLLVLNPLQQLGISFKAKTGHVWWDVPRRKKAIYIRFEFQWYHNSITMVFKK